MFLQTQTVQNPRIGNFLAQQFPESNMNKSSIFLWKNVMCLLNLLQSNINSFLDF